MQLQQEKQIAKFNLLRKCGLLAHTSPAFLKNCWIKKLSFTCGSLLTANIKKLRTWILSAVFIVPYKLSIRLIIF